MYCEVYLFDAPYHIDRPFDYSCSDDLKTGSLVRIPFGRANHLRAGVVTKAKTETLDSSQVKAVHSVINGEFSLSEELAELCFFLKDYTLCTFGEAARTILPPGALAELPGVKLSRVCSLAMTREETRALLVATGRAGIRSLGQRSILEYLLEVETADIELIRAIPGYSSAHVNALVSMGAIKVTESRVCRNPYAEYSRIIDTARIVLSPAQQRAYDKIE